MKENVSCSCFLTSKTLSDLEKHKIFLIPWRKIVSDMFRETSYQIGVAGQSCREREGRKPICGRLRKGGGSGRGGSRKQLLWLSHLTAESPCSTPCSENEGSRQAWCWKWPHPNRPVVLQSESFRAVSLETHSLFLCLNDCIQFRPTPLLSRKCKAIYLRDEFKPLNKTHSKSYLNLKFKKKWDSELSSVILGLCVIPARKVTEHSLWNQIPGH